MPVTCWTTPVTRFMFLAHLLQEHLWHRRDFQGTHLAIRPDGKVPPGKLQHGSDWGAGIVETGASLMLNARTDIRRQAMFLAREQPSYLLSLPSNLQALAEYCRRQELAIPSLKGLRSYGEVLTGETRSCCEKTWGVGMTDVYSSQEVGSIACECPEQKVKHSLPESLLLEVVKDDGTICQTGETGQVVLTTLLNYGAPLIRYALGDYAELGAPCACGRTTPVLGRIQGRSRNMLLLPNGDRLWPSFAVREWAADLPLTQFQFVQTASENIEARLVSERALTAAEKSKLVKALHQRLTYPFRIDIRYLDQLPRSNSGKYEDFICEID